MKYEFEISKSNIDYKKQITDMLDEWYKNDEKIIPYSIRKLDYNDFENYCNNLELKEPVNGLVPDSTFFLDIERNIMVGQ